MNEDVIADLKQFIVSTVSQQTANLATKDDIVQLDAKIDSARSEILDAIGETMASRDEAVDEQLANHERRIVRLEQKAA